MIVIVSSSAREAALLALLCEQRNWPCEVCATVSEFEQRADTIDPRAVVVRFRLRDGYSDDILASLKKAKVGGSIRVIVMVPADCSVRQEARQVNLGADCILRDPVRVEVLLEYLARYRVEDTRVAARITPLSFGFAGAQVYPHEHRLARLNQSIHVAPQEIGLLRLLSNSAGKVVPYPVIYSNLFNQRFAGDTANSRVLLGKITASFRRLGIDLRKHIEVISKCGYLYPVSPRNLPTKIQPSRRTIRRRSKTKHIPEKLC